MRLLSYAKADGTLHLGEWRNEALYTLPHASVLEVLSGKVNRDEQYKMKSSYTLSVPYVPPRIFAIGRNYAEHAAELGSQAPSKPLIFAKFPSCVIGTGQAIEWTPRITQQVDWEGELAVIIGKGGRDIPEEQAYEHIYGYTIANDVSARDLQDGDGQWTRAKGLDTFCPLGPHLVSTDEIPDPHALRIVTTVNGEVMQDGHTGAMIFKIPFLVAYLSQSFTLRPGDLILTGTPSGVGKARKPPRFLADGDVVSVTIEGLGTLSNPCRVRP
ncbi:MAG: fumarylacetoacetate hydrolase family protein [Anaerolineae bacterium]|nr:fumarylacetoacetate hydrolase family protein [Anaerolineae bacterium]MDW8172277.1 fumarylacetoacetate hydrolase family protein [Anaerolineae bacterium]